MPTTDTPTDTVPTAAAAIAVSPCQAADLPGITAIYRHAVLHGSGSFEIAPPDESEMTRRWQAIVGGGHPYLVARCDGMVAGYAYAAAYRPRPAYAATVEDSVYVDPALHGRGIGGALLRRLIAETEARDFRQMVAVIGDSANRASVALHEAQGFRPAGTLQSVGWKHGRWLDVVLMQLALGQGDRSAGPPHR
ncbi:MAG: N-acetyltransferase family protein [Sneathiellaceae bacterium]